MPCIMPLHNLAQVLNDLGYISLSYIYSLGNMISAQIGIERLTGASVSLEFEQIDDGKVKIKNVDPRLIYTEYVGDYHDFKLHYYDEIDNSVIEDYDRLYPYFTDILNKYLDQK